MENFSLSLPQLRLMDMFSHITDAEIEAFLSESGASLRLFEKDALVLRQGDGYTRCAIVLEGTCTTEMNDYSGQTLSLGRFQAPFPVAPGFLFSEDGKLPVSLRSQTPVKVLFIPRESLYAFLQSNSSFLSNFLRLLSRRIEYLTERVSFHSCRTIREKLLLYLDGLKTENAYSVAIPVSMEELARYFGVARPSLSQVISDLQNEGLIKKIGRTIHFLR